LDDFRTRCARRELRELFSRMDRSLESEHRAPGGDMSKSANLDAARAAVNTLRKNAKPMIHEIGACLNDNQAMALAQFTKRIGWTEVRALAASEAEAHQMCEAIYQLHTALGNHGFSPR
jgi:hypothetical protein